VHLVDIDAAFGRGDNRALLAEVVGRIDVAVELSGGIRDDASLEAALATGCASVNLGNEALESPDWVRGAIAKYVDKIAVWPGRPGGPRWLHRDGRRREATSGRPMARLDADGCARYVVTDVHRDGTLTVLTCSSCVTSASGRPDRRGGQRGESHYLTICWQSRPSSPRASRAPSSARPSTQGVYATAGIDQPG